MIRREKLEENVPNKKLPHQGFFLSHLECLMAAWAE